jgi:cytochrome c oxidase cbb3-type subunit III
MMKSLIKNHKVSWFKKAAPLTLGMLLSNGVFAQENSSEYQIPDTPMFMILLGIIALMIMVIVVLSGTIIKLFEKKELWKEKFKNISGVIVLLFLFSSSDALASGPTPMGEPLIPMTKELTWALWSVIGMLAAVIWFLSYLLQKLLKELRNPVVISEEKKESILLKWERTLTDARPVELEHDILLDHDYDGIKELDNNLPPWWKYGFYVTIVFALVYLIRFHVTGDGELQDAEYQSELLAAEIKKEEYRKTVADLVDESNVVLLEDISSIGNGRNIFMNNCAACHGSAGEGTVGPNLADDYWIHGGSISDVFKLIKYGNPQKGMIAWQNQLSPKQIQEVASFIKTLKGTNPANGKAAEGVLYSEIPTEEAEVEIEAVATQL